MNDRDTQLMTRVEYEARNQPSGVSWSHFSQIDDGYGHVDEVEAHWLWIFGFGFILGGIIASILWALL